MIREVALRSDLATYLTRSAFPADAAGLLGHLVDGDAPERVRDLVRRLPAESVFDNVGAVFQALGYHEEDHRF